MFPHSGKIKVPQCKMGDKELIMLKPVKTSKANTKMTANLVSVIQYHKIWLKNVSLFETSVSKIMNTSIAPQFI